MNGSPQCFVCMDDDASGPLLSQLCLCKSLRVHPRCLQTWIEVSGCVTCGVCKAKLRHLTIHTRMQLTVHARRLIYLGFTTHVSAFTMSVVLLYLKMESALKVVALALFSMLFLMVLTVATLFDQGHLFRVRREYRVNATGR